MRKPIHSQAAQERLTVGLDLGDRHSRYCVLSERGEVVIADALPTTKTGLNRLFERMPPSRVVLEVGTHSPWVSRHLAGLGHEVIVANPRQVALIYRSGPKDDRLDAEKLARLGRVDPQLLAPIRHRGEQAQADLAVIRAREALVEGRTKLINTARGLVKSLGERLPCCDSEDVGLELTEKLSPGLQPILEPLLRSVESLSAEIAAYDKQIKSLEKRYPEVELLQQVHGVGTLVGLTFLLTIEDPDRFRRSREVGAYLGLQPRRRESGASQPQLGISKVGDQDVRRLLVQAAHCILRQRAPDSDLRRWGLKRLERGGKNAKRKAVVAVARKLAVLLHRLWVSGEVYEPLYSRRTPRAVAA
ncbi:MAG: IS110 family transposase [Chloroflexi bacterium]|nr:IS110 family transposase [Chloroflexota bacterium]